MNRVLFAARLCLKSQKLFLEEVSTVRDSVGLISPIGIPGNLNAIRVHPTLSRKVLTFSKRGARLLRQSLAAVIVVSCLVVSDVQCQRASSASRAATSKRIFVFHNDELWLNLHHFLYVLGRAENKTTDSSRTAVVSAPKDEEEGLTKASPAEKLTWRKAVSFYANDLSKKDAVFDEPLPSITNALAQAADAKSLAQVKIDPAVASVLESAAPVYRKLWWRRHHTANVEWQRAIQKLLDQHGDAILKFITTAYQMQWNPDGFHVHLSGYTNWAGAYSTTGELLVVSSLSGDIKTSYGLETVFHEGMHQWDDDVFKILRQQASKQNKSVPNGLSHAMIFFTAGEAVRHVLPGHVPYAEKFGVWQRGLAVLKPPLENVWKPYLDGKGTRDEALAELIKRITIRVRI